MNIFELQMWMRNRGHDLYVDGFWGPKSEAAAKDELASQGVNVSPKGTVAVALEQYVMKIVGGLNVGPVDGIDGAITKKARDYWNRGPWRSTLMNPTEADERFPAAVQAEYWPKYSEIESFYGPAGTGFTTLHLPYPMILSWQPTTVVTKIQCHEKVAPSLNSVLSELLGVYGIKRIKQLNLNVFGGCVNVRVMRGGKQLSTHAYGCAIDLDPMRNALRMDHTKAAFARAEYEPLFEAFTREGWLSLGKARDIDWMHFQACRLG
jgi:D-alanyl-D-alanine carboxypeptidase